MRNRSSPPRPDRNRKVEDEEFEFGWPPGLWERHLRILSWRNILVGTFKNGHHGRKPADGQGQQRRGVGVGGILCAPGWAAKRPWFLGAQREPQQWSQGSGPAPLLVVFWNWDSYIFFRKLGDSLSQLGSLGSPGSLREWTGWDSKWSTWLRRREKMSSFSYLRVEEEVSHLPQRRGGKHFLFAWDWKMGLRGHEWGMVAGSGVEILA